jgi:hypothetical protein
MRNVIRSDSMLCRIVLFLSTPKLVPIYVERVRVGSNTTDFVRVIWR